MADMDVIKVNDIWLSEAPDDIMYNEQRGVRATIIIAINKVPPMVMTVPLTAEDDSLRFSRTIEIKKSNRNRLYADSIALIFQLRSLSTKRLIRKIGELEDAYSESIKREIKSYLQF